jgi:hypothetical protein
MSRRSTARKSTSVEESAIDHEAFSLAYPVHRAALESGKATKHVLRLLFGYTILGLPIHCCVYWLAGHSLELASTAVFVLAGGLLAVGVAKWLGLDEVLQKIPALLALVLVVVGFAYLSSNQGKQLIGGGSGSLGTLLLIGVVVSIVGGLYWPTAAAYQNVTLKTSFRDLVVGAVALVASLAVAALGCELPPPVMKLVAGTACGGFAALVVLEYAAWARANPKVGLHQAWAFSEFPVREVAGTTVAGGCFCGLGFVLFAAHLYATSNATSDHSAYILLASPNTAYDLTGSGGLLPFAGILSFATGILFVTTALDSFRLVNPFPVVRIAWDALCVFFTYPEVDHPLTHRLCLAWLRPMSIRVVLGALVLTTIATAAMPRTSRNETLAADSKNERSNATNPPYVSPPSSASPLPQGDIDLAMIEGRSVSHGGIGTFPSATTSATRNPDSAPSETTAPASGSFATRATAFAITAAAIALGAPLCVYLMVCLLGIAALPVHSGYFEKPATLSP